MVQMKQKIKSLEVLIIVISVPSDADVKEIHAVEL